MSLKMTVNYKDVILPDACIRVERMCGNKNSMKANISFRANVDSPQMFEENIIVPIDLNGSNPFKQAYNYLKLPVDPEGPDANRRDFSKAIDI